MKKVILYYKFVPMTDPDMVVRWQRELCQRLGLKGRVIVSPHGINGTLGGEIENVLEYKREMNRSGIFRNIDYKWNDANGQEFPRLSVKSKPELVAFGVPDEVKVDSSGVVGGGQHLKPEQLHKLVAEKGDEVVFFDGRNKYEAEVGKFKQAVVPDTQTTRDFITEIDSHKFDNIKHMPIVTYCTGGIRCEILTALMKNRGFTDVYQLDGGVVKYGAKYGDEGLWEGALYIFDDRMTQRFSDKSQDIGQCVHCIAKTSRFINCANPECNKLIIVCDNCQQQTYCPKCSLANKQLVQN